MKYFKRLGIAVIIDIAALIFTAVFFILGRFNPYIQSFRVPMFSALLVSGFLFIARYISSYKTSLLFDHSSILLGTIRLILAFMTLNRAKPSNSVYFIVFAFLMVVSGIAHFDNIRILRHVKGILWQPTIYLAILIMGIGIVMLIAGSPMDDHARLVYAFCLIAEAAASLLEILLLHNKQTELHEAALKIADDVKQAIKKDEKPQEQPKTVVNLLPLQEVNMLSAEEVKKLQTEGKLPNAASSLAVSAKPADKILYQEGEKKDETEEDKKEEQKKKVLFPDDVV